MISTKGSYWAASITLRYQDRPQSWAGNLDFYDEGLANDNAESGRISTEGSLHTRYFVKGHPAEVALAAVIDTLIADAGRLGIGFKGTVTDKPELLYDDGENAEFPPPEGFKHMLRTQADRIGWNSYHNAEVSS